VSDVASEPSWAKDYCCTPCGRSLTRSHGKTDIRGNPRTRRTGHGGEPWNDRNEGRQSLRYKSRGPQAPRAGPKRATCPGRTAYPTLNRAAHRRRDTMTTVRDEEAVVKNRQIREAAIGAPDPRDAPHIHHRESEVNLLAAASRTRSITRSFGGPDVRRSTRSSWRRTRISRSLEPSSSRGPTTRRQSARMTRPRRNSIGAF